MDKKQREDAINEVINHYNHPKIIIFLIMISNRSMSWNQWDIPTLSPIKNPSWIRNAYV